MLSRGWWIYAAVVAALTVVATSTGPDAHVVFVIVGVVGNMIVFVLLPRAVQLGWRRLRGRHAMP